MNDITNYKKYVLVLIGCKNGEINLLIHIYIITESITVIS